ncbi:MAG: pirin protein [Herbinix sp.]|nr:pirin protein [Herbinix sp.]
MSAGTGVYHSEHNRGKDLLRLLQIWIYPDQRDYHPVYEDYKFEWVDRSNKWFHMISSKSGDAPIKINQDMNIYSLELEKGKAITFPVNVGRQAYFVQIEGSSTINQIELDHQDALEIISEDILIKAKETSHMLILEMRK